MGPRLGSLWSQEAPLMSVSGSLKNLLGLLRSGSKYGWLNYFYSSTTSVVSCRVVSCRLNVDSIHLRLYCFCSLLPCIQEFINSQVWPPKKNLLNFWIITTTVFTLFWVPYLFRLTLECLFFFKVFSLFTRYFFYWGGPNLDENIYLLKKTFSQNLFIGMLRKKKCINIPINFN